MNLRSKNPTDLLRAELSLGVTAVSFVAKPPTFRRADSHRSINSSMEVGGSDSDGREFKNAEEMWREQVGDPKKKTDWYSQGVRYWEVSGKLLLFFFEFLSFYFFGLEFPD